jgi:PhnB protein
MSTTIKPIPEGQGGPVPYLCVNDAAATIDFYKKVFNATELMRMHMPDGRVAHAEVNIGGARLMLADEFPEMGFKGAKALGGSPVTIHLYVEDVDAVVALATANGATQIGEVQDQFYGDRSGRIEDPAGHLWYLATHKEDVSMEEMKRRSDEMFAQHQAAAETA